MTIEEIVEAYKAKIPRASTNRAVVAELAARSGKTAAQVRGILIFNHVYISTPDHERFAPDGTELKTSLSDEDNGEIWREYLRANPASPDGRKSTINEIAAHIKATPYAVERAIELPMRPRTAREREAEANEQALLELDLQEQRSARRFAAIRRVLSIAFGLFAIVATVLFVRYQSSIMPTALSPVVVVSPDYNTPRAAGDFETIRPTAGMDADSRRRYDHLSPEAQSYVRDKMKQYDQLCAKSNDC